MSINYQALASAMRSRNERPRLSMNPLEYNSAQAIYALIDALEQMPVLEHTHPDESRWAGCPACGSSPHAVT